MNRIIFALLMSFIALTASGQSVPTRVATQTANDSFADFLRDLPDVRVINSGSKILVDYEGEWTEDMKGAFGYAAKIWEENLPMCAPIRIKARLTGDFANPECLSSVSVLTNRNQKIGSQHYVTERALDFPSSMMKAQLMRHYNKTGTKSPYLGSTVDYEYLLTCDDMEITYNLSKTGEFSFNLDGVADADKYDFVTLAMRDIAFGLGMANGLIANPAQGKMLFTDDGDTPFEKFLMTKIGWEDTQAAYRNATAGTVSPGYSLNMYAPNPFINGASLQYTIPTGNNPLNYLLSHDFSKGYVMRDISNYDWNMFFGYALQWFPPVATGSGNGTVDEYLENEKTLPFKGSYSFNNVFTNISAESRERGPEVFNSVDAATQVSSSDGDSDFNTEEYLRSHSLMADNAKDSWFERYILSVQRKDGTWDVLKSQMAVQGEFIVNLDDPLPHAEEEYARSTTGKLKYRIVRKQMKSSSMFGEYTKPENLDVCYFTREFTPQTPVIAYTGKIIESEATPYSEQIYDDFVDVKVEISNVEGATQMIVEQLDEGERLPYSYEVEDFRKGYFSATLDTECSTALTLISVNKNGLRRSNTIVIPALNSQQQNISFKIGNHAIEIFGLGDTETDRGKVSYTLTSPLSSANIKDGKVDSTRKVDISTLSSGFFILTVEKNGKVIGSTKFAK